MESAAYWRHIPGMNSTVLDSDSPGVSRGSYEAEWIGTLAEAGTASGPR